MALAKTKTLAALKTNKTELLKFYRDMLLIRRFEEKADRMPCRHERR